MDKAKSKAVIEVADGSGGMAKVRDHRFDGDWQISVDVPHSQADAWLSYFRAECVRRQWSTHDISQHDAKANSGSITVVMSQPENQQLAVVWERKRDKILKVRARSAGATELPVTEIQGLFDCVHELCQSGALEHIYCRGQLEYKGLPWRGEMWLDDTLRLGAPSRQDETALIGPRVILVDSLIGCAGRNDAANVFTQQLQELSAFLSVILGKAVQTPKQDRVWTWTFTNGAVDCSVRNLGYCEQENPAEMPARGVCDPTPLRPINRPDFSQRGYVIGGVNEQSLPNDVLELWASFQSLTKDQQRQFLQAAVKWQEALAFGGERATLSFALMVVACEALKPSGSRYRNHNVYHVVEALLGHAIAERLQEHWPKQVRPQDVRNAHLHHGEFRGFEFVHAAMMLSFYDPTFDVAWRELAPITQEAIIEWLRRRGAFTIPPITQSKGSHRNAD